MMDLYPLQPKRGGKGFEGFYIFSPERKRGMLERKFYPDRKKARIKYLFTLVGNRIR